jgi:NitT/TauT family transport system ATP-binding protein
VSPPAEPLIVIERLKKVFRSRSGESTEAIAEISLQVPEKQFLCVVGPSGCGKSTLLRLIAGLESLSGGSLRIRGDEVRGPRRDIGLVFQTPVLLPWRNILKNVLVPAEVLKLDRRSARRRAEELLDLVGLTGFGER